jgi:hypothetical protein
MAYVPFIQHGPHGKRVEQFFFVAEKSSTELLPSNVGEGAQILRISFGKTRTAQTSNYPNLKCIPCRRNLFTGSLPSNERKLHFLSNSRGNAQTCGKNLPSKSLRQLKCHNIHIKLYSDWFRS